jgi:hypothetical protein
MSELKQQPVQQSKIGEHSIVINAGGDYPNPYTLALGIINTKGRVEVATTTMTSREEKIMRRVILRALQPIAKVVNPMKQAVQALKGESNE